MIPFSVSNRGRRALILLVLLLGSCATSPVKTSESRLVPPSRLLPAFSRLSQASPHKAQVTIIRDSGSLNVGNRAKLFIDGAPSHYFGRVNVSKFSLVPAITFSA